MKWSTELFLGPFTSKERYLLQALITVNRVLYSHCAFVQSSGVVPFVRSHAVEAVQGKVSQVFL